tara:strand:+ start:952 stop:1824 length:873 start_codon:yes stop_codon:yes gene_type:complete
MKDAYYFSHDSNARNDQRLMKLRMKYGPEGYGIYFMIIEILRDTENYTLHIDDIESICFDLRAEKEKVLDILKNYNLFVFDGDFFYSKSLSRRMEKLDKIKEKRRESGKLGGKAKANIKQVPSKSLASAKQVKESKVKKSKVKKSKVEYNMEGFKNQVFEYQSQYDKDMLEEFIEYWTEPNKSQTKMRYEQEKTWDTGRRLRRWSNTNFNKNISPSSKFQQNGKLDEEISNRHKNLAKQSKLFRRHMEKAKETAADPSEIRKILGQTLSKLKPNTEEEEERDGQQDLHRH